MRRFVVFFGVFASVASAAPVFSDDFESGTLLKTDAPAGQWDTLSLVANCTLTATAAAAHRGNYGVHEDDQDATQTDGAQSYLGARLPDLSGTVSFRTWVRVSPLHADNGTVFYACLNGGNVPIAGGAQQAGILSMNDTTDGINVAGFDSTGLYRGTESAKDALTDGWHLLEEVMLGMGTSSGTRMALVDGQVATRQDNVDFTNEPIVGFSLGEYFGQPRTFTGTLDFDDVRLENGPQASTLSVQVNGGVLKTGACSAVRVALQSSLGEDASAPYAFTAALSSTPGAFYADASCSGAVTTSVDFAAGDSSEAVYVRVADEGQVVFGASYVDFLNPGSQAVAAKDVVELPDGGLSLPDAGQGSGAHQHLAVGCGCSSSSEAGALSVVLVALALLRRGVLRSGVRP